MLELHRRKCVSAIQAPGVCVWVSVCICVCAHVDLPIILPMITNSHIVSLTAKRTISREQRADTQGQVALAMFTPDIKGLLCLTQILILLDGSQPDLQSHSVIIWWVGNETVSAVSISISASCIIPNLHMCLDWPIVIRSHFHTLYVRNTHIISVANSKYIVVLSVVLSVPDIKRKKKF